MLREEAIKKVINIMENKNPYGDYHKQNFNTYKSYGEMAPINKDIINNMPSSKVILSEKVYDALVAVSDITNATNEEFPFFLYGKEIDNDIYFDEFISASGDRKNGSASFNQTMLEHLENKIKDNLNSNFVVCHGHSHPPIGNLHQNFSLGDFASYLEMNQNNSVFKNKEVELLGCLVTSTQDINFVFYDNINDNFYRFTNVYVKDKNNNYTSVSCYGLNKNQEYNDFRM